MLEARVVLEAWGGVRPEMADLIAPGAVVPPAGEAQPGSRLVARTPPASGPAPTGVQTILLVVAVLATAAWAAPAAAAGSAVPALAWQLALPASLAIQWVVSRRHLSLPALTGLRAEPACLPVLAALVLTLAAVTTWRPAYGLPVALVAAWVVVPLLVRRGWWHVAGLVLLTSAAASRWLPTTAVVAVTAGLLVLLLGFAVRTSPQPRRRLPSWWVAAPAAACAALAGLLLVVGPGRAWHAGSAAAALALAPSLAGGSLASLRLAEVWHAVPQALARVELLDAGALAQARRAARRAVVLVLAKAGASLVVTTAAGSLLVLAVLSGDDAGDVRRALGLFAAFALVMVLVVAVEALVSDRSAVLVIGAADVSALGAIAAGVGSVMAVAALAAGVVALALLATPVRAPDRAFAAVL